MLIISREEILLNTDPPQPKRGEVWIVNLGSTAGTEIKKCRPAVIISSDGVGKLPIKLIAPITVWKQNYENNLWHIKLFPNKTNGLSKISAVDALQVKSIDKIRLIKKIGFLSAKEMQEIVTAVALVIDYQ
jgi:mRNA interferase MazF